ncbi:349_t:CDS:2, partial [Funneliformis geosporum]
IGRIMNFVDTIGVDPTQGTIQEAENKNSTTSENTFENVAAKNAIISNESAEEKDNTVSTVIIETTLQKRESDNLLRDSGYGEKSTSMVDNDNKRGGRSFGKSRFFFIYEISSSQEDNSVIQSNITLRRNSHLSRKGSIHSRSSRQSSVSSKFSVKTTATGVIMEGDDDPKFRNKFFTTSKSTSRKSNKSLNFLRKLWKANHQDLSSNEILEQYYQQNGNDNQ